MADWAARVSAISTKPNPRDWPVYTVGTDIDRVHNTIRLEELADVLISSIERKIAHKNIHARIL